jgi:predicted nucleic acid-binding protein
VTGYLVDTNVLSELGRPQASTSVVTFLRRIPFNDLFLCDVVLAEIRFGLELSADPIRRHQIMTWLDTFVRPKFAGRVLSHNEDVFLQWRLLKEVGRKAGYTFPEPDLLIAATALHHGLTVLTRDMEPFQRANVPATNPWRSEE